MRDNNSNLPPLDLLDALRGPVTLELTHISFTGDAFRHLFPVDEDEPAMPGDPSTMPPEHLLRALREPRWLQLRPPIAEIIKQGRRGPLWFHYPR
jgi:hypothetical protein